LGQMARCGDRVATVIEGGFQDGGGGTVSR
jgi:hypothetical protein